MMQNRQKVIFGIGGFIFAVGFFGVGFLAGTLYNIQNYVVNDDGSVEIKKVLNLYSKTRSPEVDFNQFWEVWDKVKKKHVDKETIDDKDLFYGAIEGLVKGVGDPYSVYFPPVEASEFAKDLAGEFEGIGAEIGLRDDQLVVIAPLPESPAQKAGLLAGDKILSIDGDDTFGITVEAAVSKIRGPVGTEVVLTVSSNGFDTAKDIIIVRDKINIPTIITEILDDNIVYMRIAHFNGETWGQFDKAVKELLRSTPFGFILDMRSNPGGYLQTSIDVASEWVPSGPIVIERLSSGDEKIHNSRGNHRLSDIATIVLVDGGTASGSEIVAGALQDYGRAKIIGTQTFGKGSVQEFEPFSDGSALKLTTAKWFTPNDRAIDKEGITPDILLEEMFVRDESVGEDEEGAYVDVGIQKASELLLE